MRKRIGNRALEALFEEYRADCLLAGEIRWRDQVPASTDRAAERAFSEMDAGIAAGLPLAAVGREAAGAAAKAAGTAVGIRVLAIAVAAAAVVGAGGYAAVPAVRQYVHRLAGAVLPASRDRSPEDYVIPSPGEAFRVQEEVVNDRMAVRWFRSDTQLFLVEIAYELPEGAVPNDSPEYVTVAGRAAALYESEDIGLVILSDGALSILVECFNADRQTLLDYAALLAAQNE